MKTSTVLIVYAALIVLLVATAGVAFLPLGSGPKLALGLAISATKAALIAGIFMHLRYRSGLVRIFAAAGVFWLFLLFLLTASDYLTRRWL